jgi:hypothetical protein
VQEYHRRSTPEVYTLNLPCATISCLRTTYGCSSPSLFMTGSITSIIYQNRGAGESTRAHPLRADGGEAGTACHATPLPSAAPLPTARRHLHRPPDSPPRWRGGAGGGVAAPPPAPACGWPSARPGCSLRWGWRRVGGHSQRYVEVAVALRSRCHAC